MSWKLKRTRQCKKCPWRKETNPHEIPNGYCLTKHRNLASTIADPNDIVGQLDSQTLHVMACHETDDAYCIGWLMNQIGPGNNIQLRLSISNCDNAGEIVLLGEQHETFEATLPTPVENNAQD